MIKKFNEFDNVVEAMFSKNYTTPTPRPNAVPAPQKSANRFSGNELTQDEKDMIKYVFDSYNQVYGFEPRSIEMMNSIYNKLNI